jgi:hypothetical protein
MTLYLTNNPTEELHSLLSVTEEHDQFRIPFRLRGVTSTMYVSMPTVNEYEELPHVILTNRFIISYVMNIKTLITYFIQ